MEMMANRARISTVVSDTVSLDEVNWFSVVPAWMATNEGGATPEKNFKQKCLKKQFSSYFKAFS